MNYFKPFVLIFLCFLSFITYGQQSISRTELTASFKYGLELFQKEHYGAAQTIFIDLKDHKFVPSATEDERSIIADATYYQAMAAVYQKQEDAAHLLNSFIAENPDHANSAKAQFQLGLFYFSDGQYKQAIKWLRLSDPYLLEPKDKAARTFYLGYSYMRENQNSIALSTFKQIAKEDNDHALAANYYIGYLSYEMGKYDQAITAFKKIETTRKYAKTVPMHITQIYYQLGKYDEVIAYAEPMIKNPTVRNKDQLNRLVGQTYFEQGKYDEAHPFLEAYSYSGEKVSVQDYYMLGYCAYQAKQYKNAINAFKKIADDESSLGQNASFLMADSHLKLKEKSKARNGFRQASKANHDAEVKELSAFNYAKLSYELNYYQEALSALQKFIQDFPSSEYKSEASKVLGEVLLASRDYKKALLVLEGIEPKTQEIKSIQQQVSYYRGVELYAQGKYLDAIDLFNYSIDNNFKDEIRAMGYFWKGEALYQLKNYSGSRFIHSKFLSAYSKSLQLPAEVSNAASYYSIAYGYHSLNELKNARINFEKSYKALNDNPALLSAETNSKMRNDLILRLGDVNFALNDYNNARKYYDLATTANIQGADYAFFQKAVILGLQGKSTEKIASFRALLRSYSSSAFADDAQLQIANHYFIRDDYGTASSELEKFITSYSKSPLLPKALITKALISYNNSKLNESLKLYKKVAEEYPRSQEGRDALLGIKDIYIAMNDVDGYVKYIEENKDKFGEVNIDRNSQDELSFQVAEKVYHQGDCSNSIKELGKYISAFPKGIYLVNAHYMRADCYFVLSQKDDALKDLHFVISQSRSLYSERALVKASAMEFEAENYQQALMLYDELSGIAESKENKEFAHVGIIRSSFKVGNFSKCETSARSLVLMNSTSDEANREAQMYLGDILVSQDKLEAAKLHYEKVIKGKSDEHAARALYGLALVHYKQGKFEASQDAIFKLVEDIPYYDYWLAKAFILLSDNYVQEDNLFQAKATLESIIENYQDEELLIIARRKLKEIEGMESVNED